MECPRDRCPLEPEMLDHATRYACGTCGGLAVTVVLLRRMMPVERVRELWARVRGADAGTAPCPSCGQAMRRSEVPGAAGPVRIDGCAVCQVIWFDRDELAAVAPGAASPAPVLDAPVPPDASEQWIWRAFFRTLNEKLFAGPGDLGSGLL